MRTTAGSWGGNNSKWGASENSRKRGRPGCPNGVIFVQSYESASRNLVSSKGLGPAAYPVGEKSRDGGLILGKKGDGHSSG